MQIKNETGRAAELADVKVASNPYLLATIDYAERWADLMETHLDDLDSAWEQDSHVADTDGITGNMHAMAVSWLANYWQHGERLRALHNASLGHPGIKGVVNPCFVTISVPEGKDVVDVLRDAARAAYQEKGDE